MRGWLLDIGMKSPATARAVRGKAREGQLAAIVIACENFAARSQVCEPLWLKVTARGETMLVGTVTSKPHYGYLHGVAKGQTIQFEPRHITAVASS